MRPRHVLCAAAAMLAGCEVATEPRTTTTLPPPTLAKAAPALGVVLADNRFEARVFYDGIVRPDGILPLTKRRLLVVKESRPDQGVYLAKKGRSYSLSDAFSTLGSPFVSPDDIAAADDRTVYVADGQARTVFRLDKRGGAPVAFVTTTTTRPSFNPFGVAFAPSSFDGPNVDPGDLLVADNAVGNSALWAVWAVNPVSGAALVVAEGTAFTDGPIDMAFASDGTLFVAQNAGSGTLRIVTLAADGTVAPFLTTTAQRSELAIHPITDEIFFVKDDGEIYRVPRAGGTPEFFAAGMGGTQDITFNKSGTSLFVSSRDLQQVVEIYAARRVWIGHEDDDDEEDEENDEDEER